jgi:hypothetical protein
MTDPSKYRIQYSWDVGSRDLDLGPLGDEVSQDLQFDSGAGGILDVIAHELECPFGHASRSVTAMDDLSKWKQGGNGDLVIDEIVLKLLSCHEHGV